MSYDAAVVDTAMIEDERMLRLGRGTRYMHIEALVWCKLRRTDGRIPASAISRFTDEPGPRKAAEELVRAGLWQLTADGWQIVGFTDTQMSAERVRQHQQAAAVRYDRWRSQHPDHPKGKKPSNGVGNGVSNDSASLPASLPAKQEQAGEDGDGARLREPAPAVRGVSSVPSVSRRDLGRMIREAPNVSLRDAYVSAFRKTYGANYPDGKGHTLLHRSMRSIVREGPVAA